MSKAFGVQRAADGTTSSKDAAEYYALNSQQTYQVEKTRKIAQAMSNPGTYYTNRATALEGVKTESSAHFAHQYAKLIDLHIPHSEAIIRAQKLADGMYTLLMANLENEYPADINQLSLQLVHNRGNAENGFIHPNAAVPSGTTRRSARKPRARK